MVSYWKDTIEYINKKVEYKDKNFYNWFSPMNVKHSIYGYSYYSTSTVNTYLRILVMLGFIYRVDTGKYIKVREIPTSLSFSVAKKYAYSLNPKLIERYIKIISIKNRIS